MLYLASFKYQKGVACFPEKKKIGDYFYQDAFRMNPFENAWFCNILCMF